MSTYILNKIIINIFFFNLPFGNLPPKDENLDGFLRNSTISFSSCLASST